MRKGEKKERKVIEKRIELQLTTYSQFPTAILKSERKKRKKVTSKEEEEKEEKSKVQDESIVAGSYPTTSQR